jgi:hypothetical protein
MGVPHGILRVFLTCTILYKIEFQNPQFFHQYPCDQSRGIINCYHAKDISKSSNFSPTSKVFFPAFNFICFTFVTLVTLTGSLFFKKVKFRGVQKKDVWHFEAASENFLEESRVANLSAVKIMRKCLHFKDQCKKC